MDSDRHRTGCTGMHDDSVQAAGTCGRLLARLAGGNGFPAYLSGCVCVGVWCTQLEPSVSQSSPGYRCMHARLGLDAGRCRSWRAPVPLMEGARRMLLAECRYCADETLALKPSNLIITLGPAGACGAGPECGTAHGRCRRADGGRPKQDSQLHTLAGAWEAGPNR